MSTPKGIITSTEASKLDKAFDSRHTLISTNIVKRPDNRSSWWSLKDLEDFIAHAKNQATNDLKYDLNGFRMYLGAHEVERGQEGYTTIFMVPTGEKSGSGKTGNPDIPLADVFNKGDNGQPPQAHYPQ